jgi:hypothetical protein
MQNIEVAIAFGDSDLRRTASKQKISFSVTLYFLSLRFCCSFRPSWTPFS